jgi:hypothetical protein
MNGLELMREGVAPLMRRGPDGVHREVRQTRQVSWDEVKRMEAIAFAVRTTVALARVRQEEGR